MKLYDLLENEQYDKQISIAAIEDQNHYEELYLEFTDNITALENDNEIYFNACKVALELEESILIDTVLEKQDVISNYELVISLEDYIGSCEKIGISDFETVSLEGDDKKSILSNISDKKKNILEALVKKLDNFIKKIGNTVNFVKALKELFKKYDESKLLELKKQINNGTLVPKKNVNTLSESLSKDLGVFYCLGGDLSKSTTDLNEHIMKMYNLIVKDKLYESLEEHAYDNLIVSVSNEDTIPVHKKSIEFFEKIKDPKIASWIHTSVKMGAISNYYGSKFNVLTLSQTKKGADVRFDRFEIDKKLYLNKEVSTLTNKDAVTLIETALNLGSLTGELSKSAKSLFYNNTLKNIRSFTVTYIYASVFSIFAIKRIFRYVFLASEYKGGMNSVLLHNLRDHNRTPHIVSKLILETYETKK